jgi:hypothetical protein
MEDLWGTLHVSPGLKWPSVCASMPLHATDVFSTGSLSGLQGLRIARPVLEPGGDGSGLKGGQGESRTFCVSGSKGHSAHYGQFLVVYEPVQEARLRGACRSIFYCGSFPVQAT